MDEKERVKKEIDSKFIDKVYRIIKNGMPIEEFTKILGCSFEEAAGILELCRLHGKKVEIVSNEKNELIIQKTAIKKIANNSVKPNLDDLTHTKLCVVSDTHLGNIHQQLHLLNKVYEEASKREIDTVLHCGDLVDGDYLAIRKEQGRQMFLRGFDEQAGYVVDMYPEVDGIKTKFILGSHDETHYKNGGATLGYWIPKCRKDMEYLGQDTATIDVNGVSITLDHPGDGSSKGLSYKLQTRIEELESGQKPKILLVGHYHKSYYFSYRNIQGIEVPCFCDKTQFQQKKGLTNIIGAYFLDIYSDNKGNIQFFEPEEMLFNNKDMWDEVGKDKRKVKKLVLKKESI